MPKKILEEDKILLHSAEMLANKIQTIPKFDNHITDIIERIFRQGITQETFELVNSSLIEYLGNDVAQLLFIYLDNDDSRHKLEILKREPFSGKELVIDFLDYIKVLYSDQYEEACLIALQPPDRDDWKEIERKIYQNQETVDWVIQLTLKKYSDEYINFNFSPSSALNLANFILQSLTVIPQLDIKMVDSEDVSDFNETAKLLEKIFEQEAASTSLPEIEINRNSPQ